MDDGPVPRVEELLALNSHLRQQVKQDADLIITLQLQLQEKDDIISMLRQSRLATTPTAPLPMMDKQCCADSGADSISPSRGKNSTYTRYPAPGSVITQYATVRLQLTLLSII